MSDIILPHIVTYDIQQFQLNDSIVSGVQNVSYNYSAEISPIPTWGNPFSVRTLYKKPSVSLSISKFMSSDSPPLGAIQTLFPKNTGTVPSLQTAQVFIRPTPLIKPDETPLTQLRFNDLLINSISYKFETQGFFTEEITFVGHSLESGIIPSTALQFSRTEATGITKRRADFFASGVPNEVKLLLDKGSVLTSVNLAIGFQYGEYPSYGQFYTGGNKYVKYPYDITCSFELIDRTYVFVGDKYIENSGKLNTEQKEDISLNTVNKPVSSNIIHIGINNCLNIKLGTGNYLQSSERNGGDAGQGNYTVYKYTYKNNNSSFTIS